MDLTGIWRFLADPAGQGESLGYAGQDHDFRFWREVTLPCIFDQCQDSLASYEGPGWFLREFELPGNEREHRWVIRFEAANTLARVWLNGVLLGEHRGGFLPFELPLDPGIRPGRNRLAVDSRFNI